MGYWDLGLNHIVNVDGQLLAIDADVIDTSSVLERAKRPMASQLWLVRAGERFKLRAKQLIWLSRKEVLFFESADFEVQRLPPLAA